MEYSTYSVEDLLTDESFINYCEGKSEADTALWTAIENEMPELSPKIAEAKRLYSMLAVTNKAEKEQALLRLKRKIESIEEASNLETEITIPSIKRRIAWYSVAAAVLVLLGVFAVLQTKESSPYLISVQNNFSDFKVVASTKSNERKSIVLPDGSKVVLNGLTTLKIANAYNKEDRVLLLNGEAFFEVSHDKSRPFVVIANKTTTTALGTSFKIKNYTSTHDCSIMLQTGKVRVESFAKENKIQRTQLLPGEQVSLPSASAELLKSKFNNNEIDNWLQRKLVFSKASLNEIKAKLNAIYHVEITVENTPENKVAFTGEFKNESLEQVLDAIGFSNHFIYTISNNQVNLKFEK
ncbi:FecR domain-containing protein [Solitalea sp. MAHUQ-68]|uniref:FecR domain-containing protein n=1 Tax=Solitalea agri TaxID=2953739 RepID=A0A9X2JDM0_9SPHI|nr:FecR family protein [Solitalea agri]MCO4294293.1 FecR domain-containing protein [Solitalea agri]